MHSTRASELNYARLQQKRGIKLVRSEEGRDFEPDYLLFLYLKTGKFQMKCPGLICTKLCPLVKTTQWFNFNWLYLCTVVFLNLLYVLMYVYTKK